MLPKTLGRFLLYFIKPYRITFIGMLVAVFIYAILNTLNSYALKLIIDGVINHTDNNISLFKTVLWPIVLFVLLYQGLDFCWGLYDFFKLKTLPKVRADIINSLFSHLQNHSFSFFQKNFTGTLANKVSDMARGSESVLAQLVEPMFSQIVGLLIACVTLYLVNPLFGIVLFLWSLFFLGVVFLFYKKTLLFSNIFSESNSTCMGKLVDSVTNIINCKIFARTQYEKEYLKRYVDDSRKQDEALQWHMLKIKLLQGFSVTLLFALMMGILIYARERNLVTVGDFAFILSLSMTTMQGLWYLASHFLTFSQELGICQQALSIIQTPPEIADLPNAKALKVTQGKIVFDRVSFNYERNKNVFKNKSLILKGGEKIGLVGLSGSGKTTFVSLILRFFEINSGKILIDEQNITDVTQNSLHSQIALIPQDPMLFHRSLMENIRYGRLEASDEEVIEASKKAHCHEFIELLPEGYHALVGERGLKLSGGQRQRIAIARAILKNAPILILDEATSALDSITEQKIRDSLEYLMKNRTTIVIAHRLSTLSDMDRILVFNGGQVVEDGAHEELMTLEGHYCKLWEMQAGGFLPEKVDNLEEEESVEAI